jgi:hypothetical protein
VVADLTAASERLEAQQERIASLELAGPAPSDDGLQHRIDELEGALTQQCELVDGLAVAAEELRVQQERIASLEVAQVAPSDEGLQQRIEELDRALAEQSLGLTQELAATAELVKAQQEQIASLESAGPAPSEGPKKRSQERALERQVRGAVDGLADAAARIDVQQEEIESLKSALTTSDSALLKRVDELGDALAPQVQNVVEGLTAAAERIEWQGEAIASMKTALAASDGGLQRIDEIDRVLAQRMQDMVGGLDAAVERLDVQQERIASLEASGAAAARDDGILARLDELEGAIQALVSEREALGSAVPADVEARLAELGHFVIDLRDVVEALDARLNTLGTELEGPLAGPQVQPAELERQFAEAGARFDSIVADLRNLTHLLSASMTRDHDELDARLAALRDSMTAAVERIDLLETDASGGASDVSATRVEQLEHELAALRARLRHTTSSDELASHLDALRLEVSQAMSRLERTEDLASRTAYNTSSSTSRISTAVDELGRKMEQLERLEDGLLAKLERAQALWPVALRALEGRIDDIAMTRDGAFSPSQEGLLAALQEGIATAHSVLDDNGGAPHLSGNGQHADDAADVPNEPPPIRTRRTPAKSRRTG